MNSLLKNAGIPQLRCNALPGGKFPVSFRYEQRITASGSADNHQIEVSKVDVEGYWLQVNAMKSGGLLG